MGASPQPGGTLGQYKLLQKLGEGGMGVVYLAEDTRLHRKVAIKFLPPEWANDSVRRRRFEDEARAAAALSHPGIATVHELGETGGQLFIVFEYVPGSTLRKLVVRGGLPASDVIDSATDIAAALAAAHNKGVVHRDLKPENVMRTPEGNCKVLDFGLARTGPEGTLDVERETSSQLTGVGTIVGTIGYTAPEQLEGKDVDFRADIFSFGTLVYELATGVHPFQSGSSVSTIAAVLTEEPLPLTQRNPLQPIELERIVRKCLRKRRADRYQSTLDLSVDLSNLKHDSDERPSAAARFFLSAGSRQSKHSRSWLHWLGAGIASLAFIVAAAFYFRVPSHSTQSHDSRVDSPAKPNDRVAPVFRGNTPLGNPQLSTEIAVSTVPAVKADLGITKSYDIVLRNNSSTTVFVNQCEITDDMLHKLVITPFALQRWNQEAKRWDTIVEHSHDYCGGSPFSRALLLKTAIDPGRKLQIDGDFVGGRNAFSFGDRGRFIVFLRAPGDYDDIALSPEFQIDEHRTKPAKTILAAPTLKWPLKESVFSHFPRTTELQWNPVPDAKGYVVQVDFYSMDRAGSGYWAADRGIPYVQQTTKDLSFTVTFLGAQPGRWRVWALDKNGTEGQKSEWSSFRYTR